MILSCDMGVINTAWAVINKNGTPKNYGKFSNTVKSMKTDGGFNRYKNKFYNEFETLIDQFSPKELVAERFQVRGFNAGAQTEMVGVMLGMMCAIACIPTQLVLAVTWKQYFAREYDLGIIPEGKKKKAFVGMDQVLNIDDPHICDAAGIGIWHWEQINEKRNPWFQKQVSRYRRS